MDYNITPPNPPAPDAPEIECEAPAERLRECDFAGKAFSFGIEEEYFLADMHTMAVATQTPDALFHELDERTGGKGGRESLQAQVEVCTEPHASASAAREQLAAMRRHTADVAAQYGLVPLAAGTHPGANWSDIHPAQSERYESVMASLQMIGQRNMLCGMHVHVELPDPSRRVEIMRRMTPYIPLFIALSTSSPFWGRRSTGLMGYRLAAYDELPRTGIPELFADENDYEGYVQSLVAAGCIPDASHIWWTVRPSLKYPTLELRAPDCCTRVDDAVAIACLYRVLVRSLFRAPADASEITPTVRALAVENKWTAQRHGIHGVFASEDGPLSVGDMLERVIAMTTRDAEDLGCASEISHCRTILVAGTSADRQRAIHDGFKRESHGEAILAVCRWLVEETTRNC